MLATAPPLWERVVVLAPVIVVGVGLVAGVAILLGRAFAQSLRESGHKIAILAALGIVVAAVVVLTYLGVELPRE
jgi:uncharacterized membrane protein